MKKLVFALLACLTWANVQAVTVDLHQVAFADLVRVVFNDLLKQSYVVDSAVLADVNPVTFTIRDSDEAKIKRELLGVIESRGYQVRTAGGVVHIGKRSDSSNDDLELFVYRPRFRAASYLLELSQSLFKQGSFVSSRNNQSPFTVSQLGGYSASGVQHNQMGQPVNIPVNSFQNGAFVDQGLNRQLQTEPDTIVFRGSEREVSRLKSLYSQLDVSAGELLVKAVVFEVQTGRKEASAVDLAFSILSGKLGVKLDASAAASTGLASLKFNAGGFDLSAVWDALSSDDRFKVLTSPRMRVKSGASARFSVGNETPVLSSVSYDTNGRPIQSVEYKPSGVIFELKPFVRDAVSDCKVTQQISQFVATSNGVNNSPTLIKRELSTEVTLQDGQIILLGGLDDEKSTGNATGLPFLPDFLRARRSEDVKTEVVLMLQAERLNNGI